MAIKTLVVDGDITHTKEIAKSFVSSSSIEVKSVHTKDEALKKVEESDVIVLNMLLNGMDSYELLKVIRKDFKDKIIIATSEFISADMMESISSYQINYFIKKPFDTTSLEDIIFALYSRHTNTSLENENELKLEITNLLHNLGIPSHIKGYNYIRDGVEMLYKDASLVGSITKELYPSIASTYDTTSSRVERAIRHAIEVSWVRGDYNLMEELFGNSIDYDRSKPTNSEFIVTLADRLKLNPKLV